MLFLGESRARALSTFMNASFIDCPKANSTFIVNKKCMGNAEECLSPLMFSPEKTNKTYIIKSTSSDKSYGIASTTETNATKKLNKNIISLPKEPFPINVNCHSVTNKSSTKTTTKKKGYLLLFVQNNYLLCILIQYLFISKLPKFMCLNIFLERK